MDTIIEKMNEMMARNEANFGRINAKLENLTERVTKLGLNFEIWTISYGPYHSLGGF